MQVTYLNHNADKVNQSSNINSLWPGDGIWWHTSWATLAQVVACCLVADTTKPNGPWPGKKMCRTSKTPVYNHIWYQQNQAKISPQSSKSLCGGTKLLNQCWLMINGFLSINKIGAFSQEILMIWLICKTSLKSTLLKLLQHLPGASKWSCYVVQLLWDLREGFPVLLLWPGFWCIMVLIMQWDRHSCWVKPHSLPINVN